jgi:hypothetical protein
MQVKRWRTRHCGVNVEVGGAEQRLLALLSGHRKVRLKAAGQRFKKILRFFADRAAKKWPLRAV